MSLTEDKLPKGVEESVPDSVHDTGSSKSHATGDSIVPKAVQEAVPKGLEEALPNKIHDTSGLTSSCKYYMFPSIVDANRYTEARALRM